MSTSKPIFLILIVFVFHSGVAQEKWTATFRPGLNFLTTDISNSNTQTGYGFEFIGNYRVLSELDAYVGWGWNQFKGDDFLSTENSTFNETGFTLGFKYFHPIENTAIAYNIMVGAVYDHIEVENPSGDLTADSGYDLGWQIGGGFSYTFGENWLLQPELRYRSVSAEVDIPSSSNDISLNYISFGIGLGIRF